MRDFKIAFIVILIAVLTIPVFAETASEKNVDTMLNQVWELIILEKYDESFEICDKVLKIDQDNAVALAYRGILYARKGEFETAFADCNRALEIDQHNKIVWYGLGDIQTLKGNYGNTQATVDN